MIPVIVVDSCTKTGWECQKKNQTKKNPNNIKKNLRNNMTSAILHSQVLNNDLINRLDLRLINVKSLSYR